ncbi:MAG: histidine kinase [Saprospiraceae bacterium]|nr:histidine kinase [Saprospiraceae bacterium]
MRYYITAVLIVIHCFVIGQHVPFKNINTNHGLSSNLIYNACQGPDGLLWIIANRKLDSYNAGEVVNYTNAIILGIEKYKLAEVLIDRQNIVWLRSIEGDLLYLDEKRNLIHVELPEVLPDGILNYILTEDGEVHIIAKKGHFYYNVVERRLEEIHLFSQPIFTQSALQISNEEQNRYLFTVQGKAILYDANKGKVEYEYKQKRVTGAALIGNRRMLISTGLHHELFLIDMESKKVIKNLAIDIQNQYPETNTYYRRIKHIYEGHIGITSGHQGLFILDEDDLSVQNYSHDFSDPSSISSDNSFFLYANDFGNVFVTSRTSGLNILNTRRRSAKHIKSFVDHNSKKIFEGHISHIVKDKQGSYWLASSQGLIKYDPIKKNTTFNIRRENKDKILSIISMYIDEKDRKWVGVSGGGLDIVDSFGKSIRSFQVDKEDKKSLKSNFVYTFSKGVEGDLWVGTSRGINIFDIPSMRIKSNIQVDTNSVIKTAIREIKTIGKETFVGTWRKGCYVFSNGDFQVIDIPQSLNAINISAFGKDKDGRLLVGSENGLFRYVDKGGTYTYQTKLLPERILSIDKDKADNLWVATENILYKLNAADETMEEYTHIHGFTGGGFRMHASYMDQSGLLHYGLNTGMCSFDPLLLSKDDLQPNPHITGVIENNQKVLISGDAQIKLKSDENNIGFYYQNIDLWNNPALQYQYSVSSEKEEWIPAITNPVLIQNIKPGAFEVKLRASLNGEDWTTAPNRILLGVDYPWWRSYYFYALSLLIASLAFYFAFRLNRKLKLDKSEELKYDESLKFFSFSMHKYGDMDEEFWEVILECIRQLDIDACAIYLLNNEKNTLWRQAVKTSSPKYDDYLGNKEVVPLQGGAFESVVNSKTSKAFDDLSIDGNRATNNRLSKICVPILSGDEVLGLIDCEHESKSYFNERRLSFISAISTIVATKIVAYNAEEERKEAEISLSNNLKKVSELEMKSLRSQMNPHFMFNSLNSINNFIVKNDQENASDYLTSFAQLMRIILENSRQDWVSLDSELNALRLYVGMEKLRFENQFFYHELISDKVNVMSTMVPPMLIQPYIENAIWHGLLPKKSEQCNLKLIIDQEDDMLKIIIDDDGIGTKLSKLKKSSFNVSKKSFGMKIISERLEMINKIYHLNASVQLIDKSDISESESGTKVTLSMKMKKM